MIYGPYRGHATRGRCAGTQPTPWDEDHRRNGSRAPQTPDAKARFTVKALEQALRAWMGKRGGR